MKKVHWCRALILACCTTAALVGAAFALDPYDVPVVSCEGATLASITLHVCGGAVTGAPAGVTIQWKTAADFAVSGWDDDGTLCKLSLSGQPSLQHPDKSRWELLPGECEDIVIGDINFDETGVSGHGCGLEPLVCGTEYVFRWFAHAGRGFGRSDFGGELTCSTAACPPQQCTFTQGYWKTHGVDGCRTGHNSNEWPASIVAGGMDLGNNHYTADELCTILNTPAAGKGLIALAHQLIAAQLNIANGATECALLTGWLREADNDIGNVPLPACPGCARAVPPSNGPLTAYNEGGLCEPNCHSDVRGDAEPAAIESRPWGQLKELYR